MTSEQILSFSSAVQGANMYVFCGIVSPILCAEALMIKNVRRMLHVNCHVAGFDNVQKTLLLMNGHMYMAAPTQVYEYGPNGMALTQSHPFATLQYCFRCRPLY